MSTPPTRNELNVRRPMLRQPAFIIAVLLLATAAAGLNAATGFLKLHFKKSPVALRRDLMNRDGKGGISATLGPWIKVSKDHLLDPDIQETLGTEQYVFSTYVDSRKIDAAHIAELKTETPGELAESLMRVRRAQPGAVVNMAVTYYTGLVDTVAHIPDRCYIADGYQPQSYDFPTWNFGPDAKGNPGKEPLGVRFINFQDQTTQGRVNRSVAYFFNVDGQHESDPLAVRADLADLFQKYGYYAKIETMTLMKDKEASAAVITDFLSYAMPQIQQCLPDWKKVTAGE